MPYRQLKACRDRRHGKGRKLLPVAIVWLLSAAAIAGIPGAAGEFTVTVLDDRVSVTALDAPLQDVIESIRQQAGIDVDGQVGEEDRVNAHFEDLPIEQAIVKLTDRYVIVHDEADGRAIRIVLFREGEDIPLATAVTSSRTLNAQALEAWQQGDIRSATAYFEAAVARNPDDWVPRADYGRLLVLMTDYQAAGPHLERAAQLNAENPRIWLDLYSYYQRTLQLELAQDARRLAAALADGRAIVQDPSGLWHLEGGTIYPGS